MAASILKRSRAKALAARLRERGSVRIDGSQAAAWGWSETQLADAALTLQIDGIATLCSDGSGTPTLQLIGGK